ncbi:MAG: hypothetical protein K0Q55_1403, partial [Verrucomicrobia bacterium]|nr:hypothetical protein [Verrucomicrobiota bacterium]
MKTRLTLLGLLALTAFGLHAQEQPVTITNSNVKLAVMDKLRFRVEEDPSSGSKIIGVNSLGQVSVPVSVGFEDPEISVDAKGLTLEELSAALKQKLEGKYYKKATIKLTLVDKSQKGGEALFSGECRGVMPLPANEEVLLSTALIKLNPSEFANLRKVEVYRADKVTGKKMDPIIMDMEAVIKKGDRRKEKDLVLQDGD